MYTLTSEQKEFLQQGTRTGKLATVRKDGRPHVVPIWFVLDGDTLIFNTGDTTVKAANMRRDARVTICVDDENPPFSFIVVEGIATLEANSKDLTSYGLRVLVVDTWAAIKLNSLVSATVQPKNWWCGLRRRRWSLHAMLLTRMWTLRKKTSSIMVVNWNRLPLSRVFIGREVEK